MAEWDPTRFKITVGAIDVVEFASGTFIKAEHNEDLYSLEVGADGRSCRIRNANESGRYEVTLLKSSPSNDLLAALSVLDRQNGQGIVPVQVKDLNGSAVAASENTWVVKPAPIERGKELGEVTWILETEKLELFTGGIVAF